MPAGGILEPMSALSRTGDSSILHEDHQGILLPEQLVEFANEAFVFADAAKTDRPEGTLQPTRFSPLSPAFFADVMPPPLAQSHLGNARLVATGEQILNLLPKGGICMVTDTRNGWFAQRILCILKPDQLFLCDRDFGSLEEGTIAKGLEQGRVELLEGDAAEHLADRPDGYFDLIHLRPEHSYGAAARALEQAGRKVKAGGCIICADYTMYSPLDGAKCGVARAVNEFCHRAGFEIICLALNALGYHEVALRRCAREAGEGHLGGAFLDTPDPATFLPDVWEHLIQKYQIQSVLDVGAGAGWSTKWFVDRGIYTLGVEGWVEALQQSQCRANIVQHDYTVAPFIPSMLLDLAWCAGFVEHIDEEFIPNFMASFCACKYVCLIHAEPGQAGHHHVNCRTTDYWVRKMSDFGFDHDAEETAYLRSTDKHKAPWGRKTLTFFRRRDAGAQ
jgi:SAM-dependent methyltransferase